MSIVQITGLTGPRLFRESIHKMRVYAQPEQSRNGDVETIQSPVILRLLEPKNRVLTDTVRDANPFFHVMEFVWMMAGSNKIQWISKFNRNMLKYSDDGVHQHAAYGHRWRRHYLLDQVKKIINLLRKNPLDRRLVINMWDPEVDLGSTGVDIPCNTQLLFRVVEGELQMTVVNRSNDLVWGALGANLCHMTMLHELIANAAGLSLGTYYAFTQNLHIYRSVPNFDYYMKGVVEDRDIYEQEVQSHVPLLQSNESYAQFVEDCERLVQYAGVAPITFWMKHVGYPIYQAWHTRKKEDLDAIMADDWRIACTEWVERRKRAAVGDQYDYTHPSMVGGVTQQEVLATGPIQSMPVAGVDSGGCEVGISSSEPGPDCSISSQPF